MKDDAASNTTSGLGIISESAMAGFSTYTGAILVDTAYQEISTAEEGDVWKNTSESGQYFGNMFQGNPVGFTGTAVTATSTSAMAEEPDLVVGPTEVFFRDQKDYSKIERSAKKIYDKFNTNHDIQNDEGATLITEDEEIASMLERIIHNRTKTELLIALDKLQSLADKKQESSKQDELKLSRKHGKK